MKKFFIPLLSLLLIFTLAFPASAATLSALHPANALRSETAEAEFESALRELRRNARQYKGPAGAPNPTPTLRSAVDPMTLFEGLRLERVEGYSAISYTLNHPEGIAVDIEMYRVVY